jgi:hypothetical protein
VDAGFPSENATTQEELGRRFPIQRNRKALEAAPVPKQVPAVSPDVSQIMEGVGELAGQQVVTNVGVVVPNIYAIMKAFPPSGRRGRSSGSIRCWRTWRRQQGREWTRE